MTGTDLRDPAVPTVPGRRRNEVLAQLRAARTPISVADLAQQTGLHVNTARFHLDALVGDGLAERSTEQRVAPGRPRVLYAARGPAPGARSYRLLAEMLTSLVATLPQPGAAAVEAGRDWGRHLVDRVAPSRQLSRDEAVGRVTRVLDDVGFRPEAPDQHAEGPEIRLHHCPFREIAEQHQEVVCGIHLGLMRGALEELRTPLRVTALDPFVTPTLCVARLGTPSGSAR